MAKNGLAIWHYRHRTLCDNIRFFAENGFDAVSIGGKLVSQINEDGVAEAIKTTGITLTVHTDMAKNHSSESVSVFRQKIEMIAEWQEKHRLISVLSFDVPENIRDNVRPYIDFALERVKDCRVALEDFGLTEKETAQIEYLKGNERFGFLIDIEHMYIRLCGTVCDTLKHITLFQASVLECSGEKAGEAVACGEDTPKRGIRDMIAISRGLREIGYDGNV